MFFEHLNNIAKLYGFRVADGIKDRVIYKELFLQGLTVLDVKTEALKGRLTMSHLAAKQEIKSLAEYICPQN
jgi:chromosome partitioning protein